MIDDPRPRTTFRPITDSSYRELDDMLCRDNHPMVAPNYTLHRRDGDMIGALSIDAVPTVFTYLSPERTNYLDILSSYKFINAYCDSISTSNCLFHVGPDSPAWKLMDFHCTALLQKESLSSRYKTSSSGFHKLANHQPIKHRLMHHR